MTTLKKTDGTTMIDLEETTKTMAEKLTPKYDDIDDTHYHKQIRTQAKEQILTEDDREYKTEEVKNAIEELKLKKAPGEKTSQQKYIIEYINNSR